MARRSNAHASKTDKKSRPEGQKRKFMLTQVGGWDQKKKKIRKSKEKKKISPYRLPRPPITSSHASPSPWRTRSSSSSTFSTNPTNQPIHPSAFKVRIPPSAAFSATSSTQLRLRHISRVITYKMSRPHDAQRPFFPFGNPFRMISPKGSHLSSKLLAVLNNFEETLADRFRKLDPKETGDVLSLTWMEKAMKSLCETHGDIKNLITTLELPVCDWDDKWIDVYLDISVKLLDLCNAFSSEISRLNQGRLMLQCVLHNLESSCPEQFIRASSSLDRWRHHISSRNPRFENCGSILDGLKESLDLPKVKNSAKGKVLMRAMYGVKVQTLFVCSVFVAAFSGSAKKLLELSVSDTHLWGLSFTNLLTSVNSSIRNRPSTGSVAIFKEQEAVEANVNKLSPLIRSGEGTVEEESVRSSVSSLRGSVDHLSQGLDLLEKEVDGFFQVVLSGRDALLCNLRANGPASTQMQKNIVER